MNKLSEIFSRPVREDVYKYGLSTLHMWIRCMECILHISYNMDFELRTARGANEQLKAAKKHKAALTVLAAIFTCQILGGPRNLCFVTH